MIPFSSFGANSISWNSEEDLFSVQYENATVKDILDYIEKHSKYIFIYSANVQKNLNNKVSISVSNKKIDAVLKELFSETGLNYKMSGRQITISIPEAPKVQQATQQKGIKVTGNVSDEKGEPLIGVTIILKNDSTVHSLTDMNGNYSITVPAKRSVLVSVSAILSCRPFFILIFLRCIKMKHYGFSRKSIWKNLETFP